MKSKIISTLIIIATFLVAMIKMADNSGKFILHWDFQGNVTSYGTKYYIIFIPIIATVLYFVLLYYEKNPFKMNRMSRIKETPDNARALTRYIQVTAPLVLAIALYVTLCSAQIITLHPWVILAILLFIVIFYFYTYTRIR